MTPMPKPLEGACTCQHVRYQLKAAPLIVHCCHCLWCQRQTGSAFAINALFLADEVELLKGEVKAEMVDSPSGKGQMIARCPKCDIAVWSNYFMGGFGKASGFYALARSMFRTSYHQTFIFILRPSNHGFDFPRMHISKKRFMIMKLPGHLQT